VDETHRSLVSQQVASFEAVREEWEALAYRTRNVFATWEWNAAWWTHFAGSKSPLVTTCRSPEGRLVAVLPLYLWRKRPLRIVRFLGHDAADQLGPICLPEDRPAVAGALGEVLSSLRTDIFVAEHLACDEGWSARLQASELGRESSPVLRYPTPTWSEFLQARSRNFREQARRREAKLAERFDVRFRLANDAEQLDRDLDALFRLHRARWEGGRTTFARAEAFQREFAARALERGWLRLWFLEVDRRPRAACYGFRFGDVESFYQGGRDPAWNEHSVGFIVLVHAIREALSDGMVEYRLLRGDEPYKNRFANEDHGLETVAITRTAMSRRALQLAVAARRSKALKRATGLLRR
jgi:CelD/BcsL family acetyltransferase involved in cellulose biosynthesis